MGLDLAHYHAWQGQLRSPWWATLAMVRVALLQVFRRKLYWIVLALGLLNFLAFWAAIYLVTQVEIPAEARERFLDEAFGFRARPEAGEESGYIMFMQRQSVVVMMLLAFSGSVLVGNDFRTGALPFYLSRRIDRRHYIVGKLLAVSVIVSLLTTVPALVLFLEYGLFTSSFEYWFNHWHIAVSVLAYGLVLCVALSILLVTLSAYLQRAAPIAITWASMFVMLSAIGAELARATGNEYWRLIDPWRQIRYVGRLLFGTFDDVDQLARAETAAIILPVVCLVALLALVRRVRAVDVVAP